MGAVAARFLDLATVRARIDALVEAGKMQEVIDYLLSGLDAGMTLPDPADPSLNTIRVMR